MWPFQKKSVRQELSPLQKWCQMWQKQAGISFMLEDFVVKSAACKDSELGYWITHEEEILAVVTGKNAVIKELAQTMPVMNPRYDAHKLLVLPASVVNVDAVLLGYACHSLRYEVETMQVWVRSDVYDERANPLMLMNTMFRYTLFYHLLVPRFKEQERSLSWHISTIKNVASWQQKDEWATLHVIAQAKEPSVTVDFWLAWPEKGDTQGFWKNVIKRFCYHTARNWQEARVEIIYKEIPERVVLKDCLGVQGEIRYKEPYRLPMLLLFSRENMQMVARQFYTLKYPSFWYAYHQLRLNLWGKNHEIIERMALHGGLYNKERIPSVADFLLFLPESEQDKILHNFIAIFYSEKFRALFCYQVSVDKSDVRWVTSDLFEHNLLARLPRNIADDWLHLNASSDMEQWQQLNEEVLYILSKRVRDGQLALSVWTQLWLTRWVFTPYQERFAQKFEDKYRYFHTQWNLMSKIHRHQLTSKIHNGQWLYILLLKPQFLEDLQHFISQGRLALLKEEIMYHKDSTSRPYEEALRVLHQIADVKY